MKEKPTVLIVDDEADIRELVEITLSRMGLRTDSVATVGEAKERLGEQAFDLCITDMRLPDGTGIDLVRHIQRQHTGLPVAVITAYGSAQAAVESLKAGAFDFVSKPVDVPTLRKLVEVALKLSQPDAPAEDNDLLGDHPSIQELRGLIERLARSQAPVHITGESGTGKELVARLIHQRGPRSAAPFVPVNCGAIPSELMESEFFGHIKGSFTGAVRDKPGLFQAAEGGTLFLDEVGDLPLHMQVKLLRALQERAVRPVGGETEVPVNVRIISATHRDLAICVAEGTMRQDLYYRLNVIEVRTPPLRERREDIEMLAARLLERLSREAGIKNKLKLSHGALNALITYDFPGNVRELENVLERAVTLCDGESIQAADLQLRPAMMSSDRPAAMAPASAQTSEAPRPVSAVGHAPLPEQLEEMERQAIQSALEKARYNKTRAADLLGMSFRQLRYKIKKLGIE